MGEEIKRTHLTALFIVYLVCLGYTYGVSNFREAFITVKLSY